MNKIAIFLFYLSIVSIIGGPLVKLPFTPPQVNLYMSDFVAFLSVFLWIFYNKVLFDLLKKDNIIWYFLFFIFIGFVSLLHTPININVGERIISLFYLIRYAFYFIFFVNVKYLCQSKWLTMKSLLNYFVVIGVILSVFGWLQYFLYPDLRNLFYLGWDPHDKRIFATYFDPNFLGLILLLSFFALFFTKIKTYIRIPLYFLLLVTILFTYSRSTYLSFLSGLLFYAINTKRYLYIGLIILFATSVFLLPRGGGESVKLERLFSIKERFTSWKQALIISLDHPLLGVGFNTTRYAKKEYGFASIDWESNHSGGGFENSYLFVLATTGLIGFASFLVLFVKTSSGGDLFYKISFLAICIQSIFINALFFPPVVVWIWLLVGLRKKVKNQYQGV